MAPSSISPELHQPSYLTRGPSLIRTWWWSRTGPPLQSAVLSRLIRLCWKLVLGCTLPLEELIMRDELSSSGDGGTFVWHPPTLVTWSGCDSTMAPSQTATVSANLWRCYQNGQTGTGSLMYKHAFNIILRINRLVLVLLFRYLEEKVRIFSSTFSNHLLVLSMPVSVLQCGGWQIRRMKFSKKVK